jgi:uncharacterized protein HemX
MIENSDRAEQRRHWRLQDRMLGAILTILSAAVLGGAGWVLSAEGRIGRVETTQEQLVERADNDDDRHAETMRRLSAAEAARAESAQAIARVEERITSQGRSLTRMEKSLAEIARYLRGRGQP